MAAVLTLLVVVTLALIISRVATVALTMTGMPLEQARFQARSALTGTGFTTSEAEAVVNHPVRRRIAMMLMLASGAGAVSVLGSFVLSFAGVHSTGAGLQRGLVIVGALAFLLWLSHNPTVDRVLRRVIERALRRSDFFEVSDHASLLHLHGGWRVVRVPVRPRDWVSSQPLGRLDLPAEGVTVLGVERSEGTWVGAPSPDLRLQPGDQVVLYGRSAVLEDLAGRMHDGHDASRRFRDWHASAPVEEPRHA